MYKCQYYGHNLKVPSLKQLETGSGSAVAGEGERGIEAPEVSKKTKGPFSRQLVCEAAGTT